MLKNFFEKKVINKYVTEISTFCIVGKYPQKIFLKKSKKVYKNAEFHADFRNVEKFVQKCTKKKLETKMCQKFSIFQLLLKIQKLYLLITFNRGIVLNFFQHIWNQCEILRFLIPISIFSKKKIF